MVTGWRKRQILDLHSEIDEFEEIMANEILNEEEEYDVSIDVLTKHRDKLWKITQENMNAELLGIGIMDDIRLNQIDQLDESIRILQKSRKTALNTSL